MIRWRAAVVLVFVAGSAVVVAQPRSSPAGSASGSASGSGIAPPTTKSGSGVGSATAAGSGANGSGSAHIGSAASVGSASAHIGSAASVGPASPRIGSGASVGSASVGSANIGSAASVGSANIGSAAGIGSNAGSANAQIGSAASVGSANIGSAAGIGSASGSGSGAAGAVAKTSASGGKKTAENTWLAIKVIIGLVSLMVLAYLGGHRRVVRYQERLGISGVITAGFPFVAFGLIASLPSVGVLTGDVLDKLRPVLQFGLGWLGFIIGAQLDIRVLDRVPKGTAYLVVVEALLPFAITAGACGAVMLTFGIMSVNDPALWRDLIMIGTVAAMTAPRKFRGMATRTWHEGRGVDVLLGQLDELVSIVGLLFVTAYFRDATSTTWQLPDTAWIFVSLGLGVTVGVLIFAMIRVPTSDPEFLAVVLGGIAFASGLAGYLHLSPIVVCFIAGVLVTNFPNEQRDNVFVILRHLERPVQLIFLIIVGAVWDVGDWRGWILIPVFVAGRALGKWTGILASKTAVGALLPSGFAERRELITPMSGLSIALVISIASLYHDAGLPWIVTAVIGGSIVTELLLQKRDNNEVVQPIDELSAPIDELDDTDSGEIDGPIYRDEEVPPK